MTDITYTYLPLPQVGRNGDLVYFIYSAGRIKIGYSTGIDQRNRSFRSSGPIPPVVILVINGTIDTERTLHIRFSEDRLHGEWFTLSDELRKYLVARLCDRGIASLDRAETEFREYCETFLAEHKPPPKKRQPRPRCVHDMPIYGNLCPACERERDLKILDGLQAKEAVCSAEQRT